MINFINLILRRLIIFKIHFNVLNFHTCVKDQDFFIIKFTKMVIIIFVNLFIYLKEYFIQFINLFN